jgi:hypothetical protein
LDIRYSLFYFPSSHLSANTAKSRKFTIPSRLPVRTIGWDIAITPNGPVILEANIWWGAPNEHRRMYVILEAMSDNSK